MQGADGGLPGPYWLRWAHRYKSEGVFSGFKGLAGMQVLQGFAF